MVACLEKKTDVLVIGGGAAGLMAAIKAARSGCMVLVITDGAYASSDILGFNALVSDEDSRERFFQDIYEGGEKVNDPELIYAFIDGTAQAVQDLEELGLKFDKKEDGSYHLLQPLGCSVPRLVHSGNKTGFRSMNLMLAELNRLNVEIWEHTVGCGLRTADGKVVGAWAYRRQEKSAWCIRAKATVMATGGGHILKGSTYPTSQTGDGYAMGYHVGAKLRDMEFFQYEPCRAIWPKPLGISTTLLAKGGKLTNADGERFVLNHHPNEGAASKAQLARYIAWEQKKGKGSPHGGAWLDLTDLPEEEIRVNHAMYDQRFRNVGIDLCKDRVEVGPAAHSIMGGLCVDAKCAATVPGLYACGEAMGGLHGANRLGGNAGAEVYVFGSIAGTSAAEYAAKTADWDVDQPVLNWNVSGAVETNSECADKIAAIRDALGKALSPIRDEASMLQALQELKELKKTLNIDNEMCWKDRIDLFKAENLLTVGSLMIQSALTRQESRGVHVRQEYPDRDDENWNKCIFVSIK